MVPSIGKYYLDFPRKNRARSFEVKSWDFLREIQVTNFLLCIYYLFIFYCSDSITLSIIYLFIVVRLHFSFMAKVVGGK